MNCAFIQFFLCLLALSTKDVNTPHILETQSVILEETASIAPILLLLFYCKHRQEKTTEQV